MKRLLKRFGRDQRGLAAVEFAFVLPILLVLHLGTFELVQAWEAQRRAVHVAEALADLTAQNRTVTTADLTDIMAAGPVLIAPFNSAYLGERISSLVASSSGAVTVDWTVSQNFTGTAQPTTPANFLVAGESAIVVDVTYNHRSFFGLVGPATILIQKHAYLRPRLSKQVSKI